MARRVVLVVESQRVVDAMVCYLVRGVVKHGHRIAFLAAFEAWNTAAAEAGLPRYRLYESTWGTYGEVFAEAEYVDSADIERRIAAAAANDRYAAAHDAVLGHLVDGGNRDYVLSELDIA